MAALATIVDRMAAYLALLATYPGNRGAQYLGGYALLVLPATSIASFVTLMTAAFAGGAAVRDWVPLLLFGSWFGYGLLMDHVSKTSFGQRFIWHDVPYQGRERGFWRLSAALLKQVEAKMEADPARMSLRERFDHVDSEESFRKAFPIGPAAEAGCARWLAGSVVHPPEAAGGLKP